jgi:hypothetical protein
VIKGFDERASEKLKSLCEELERRSCMNFEIVVTDTFKKMIEKALAI